MKKRKVILITKTADSEISIKINKSISEIIKDLGEGKSTLEEPIINFFNKDLYNYLLNLTIIEQDNGNKRAFFDSISDNIIQKARELELTIKSNPLMKKIKSHFRLLVGPWMYQSVILKRAYEKPRGYPGDYMLLEFIYNNLPVTDKSKIIGYYSDLHFLDNELAYAVRERKDKMKDYLNSFLKLNINSETKILNFASGPVREIRELLDESEFMNSTIFSCVDFDSEALKYSKNLLKERNNIKFNYIQEDIIKLSLGSIKNKSLINHDLIYSIGLIDYLPDRILRSFLHYCFSLLSNDGQLILAHKDCSKVSTLVEDWCCDWHFYERCKDKVMDIFQEAGINRDLINIAPLKSEGVYYLIVNKQ